MLDTEQLVIFVVICIVGVFVIDNRHLWINLKRKKPNTNEEIKMSKEDTTGETSIEIVELPTSPVSLAIRKGNNKFLRNVSSSDGGLWIDIRQINQIMTFENYEICEKHLEFINKLNSNVEVF